jgi:glycosyltransferase involved in cell wall biosynthesis
MKIALIAPPFLCIGPNIEYGGIERIVYNLGKELSEMGHECYTIAPNGSRVVGNFYPTIEKPIGVETLYERKPDKDALNLRLEHIALALKAIEDIKPDIAHIHDDNFYPHMVYGLIRTPNLITFHSVYEDFFNSDVHPGIKNKEVNSVAVSEALKRQYEEHEIPVKYVVHNGLLIENFPYSKEKMNYLYWVGVINRFKGTMEAIEIAIKLNRDLIISGIVGDQQYFNEIEGYITHRLTDEYDKLGAYLKLPKNDQPRIVYTGKVNEEQRNFLMKSASCTLVTSTFDDPLPTVTLESQACGTPVIGFNKGGIPEMIIQGETGFVVQNIEEALERLEKINEINPQNCRINIEKNFSSRIMAEKYLEIYREIISR